MIKFYIELEGDVENYRLQECQSDLPDDRWKIVNSRELNIHDYLTTNVYEIIRFQEKNSEIILNNKKWDLNWIFGAFFKGDKLNYKVFVYRDIFPLTPSREQLVATIRQGDSRFNNSLIINIYGYFELRPSESIDPIIIDPTIVLIYERFVQEDGSVGIEASGSTSFIDRLYISGLTYWLYHLKSNEIGLYAPYWEHAYNAEALQEIDEMRSSFKK